METSSSICKNCREKSVIFDHDSSSFICSSCGAEQACDLFRSHFEGSFNAHVGTFVRVGASEFSYRDRKRLNAETQIDDVASSLGLSSQCSSELRDMIYKITDGEFGLGNWFLVLIAACAHVIMRQHCFPLPLSEVAAITGSELHELGRMVTRVVDFLGLTLPEFDIVTAFERYIKSCHCFSSVLPEILDQMLKQGSFLLQCCMKWFLTTGRQPMPVIAAVSAFVAEVNEVDVKIEDIAKEMYAGVRTSKLRYKELKETLIQVAQALPWGKDITNKNLVQNAPFVLRYMLIKSKQDPKRPVVDSKEVIQQDLQEMLSDCLRKKVDYITDGCLVESDSEYFRSEEREGMVAGDNLARLEISEDCLWNSYMEYFNLLSSLKSTTGEASEHRERKRKRGNFLSTYEDWWAENFDLKRRLPLDEILERNVGFDAVPPSFMAGMEARKRRQAKIKFAKRRINNIMRPKDADSIGNIDIIARKEWKRKREGWSIDSEDLLIELLLLHGADEEKIECGHYKALLGLHIL